MTRKHVITLGLAALLLFACDLGTDGTTVVATTDPVSFFGLHPVPGQTVEVHARSTADGLFHPVTSGTATGPQFSGFGTDWWLWDATAALPANAWRAGVKGARAETRAFDGSNPMVVFPLGGDECLEAEDVAGSTLSEAQATCEATNDRSAFVYTQDYQGMPEFEPGNPLDYPKELQHDETSEMQGVATDGVHWFFSNNSGRPGLVRIPISEDLGDVWTWFFAHAKNIPDELYDKSYRRIGDLDEHNGQLFVPCEFRLPTSDSDFGVPAVIAQFDTDLQLLGFAELDSSKAPWVAIDPVEGKLYTSAFEHVRSVDAYVMVFDDDGVLIDLRLEARRKLSDGESQMELQYVQGGAFSPHGNLYLVSDNGFEDRLNDKDALEGGVYGFEGATMRLETQFAIDYDPWGPGEQLQGLDVFPLPSDVAPNITEQVHVVMLDNDNYLDDDDLYFKHFGLANLSQLPWL